MFRSSFIHGGARSRVNLQGMEAAEEERGEAALHVGAPRDIGRYAPDAGGVAGGAATTGRSAGDAAKAIGRRLSSLFRGDDRRRAGAGVRQQQPQLRRSKWWFLLPIFLHAVGGIMAFFVLREDDVRTARNCLYLGLSLTALMLGPLVVLAAMAGSGTID